MTPINVAPISLSRPMTMLDAQHVL